MNIFITGASSGIGEALAQQYAGKNVCLGLVARERGRLFDIAARCEALGATVVTYEADVTDFLKMHKIATDFLNITGSSIDLVIANAGIREVEDDFLTDISIPRKLIEVNYLGVINTFSPFLRTCIKQSRGSLTVISSISSLRATHNSGAYSASKAAVDLWCEALRLRLLPYKVNVTVINLGFVSTAMTKGLAFKMPGILSPERAAELISAKINKRVRSVTLPWQSRIIWGIFCMMPGKLYDFVINFAKSRQKDN